MRQHFAFVRRALALCVLALIPASMAYSTLATDYAVTMSAGAFTTIGTGATRIMAPIPTVPYGDTASTGPIDIGFTFKFGCNTFTQFNAATAGFITLGSGNRYGSRSNDLAAAPNVPIIAPFWDILHIQDRLCSQDVGVFYSLTGSAPNRVAHIEWRTGWWGTFNAQTGYWGYGCPSTLPLMTFQMRLYETSNRIEFTYGSLYPMPSSTAIGIAASQSDFLSIALGNPTTLSSTTWTRTNSMASTLLASGTTIAFQPRPLQIVGRTGPGNGGTTTMTTGDVFFNGFTTIKGNTSTYTPMDLVVPCPWQNTPYSLSITGPAAADYSFVATGTQSSNGTLNAGQSLTPQINFTPSAVGVRQAQLTFVDNYTGATRTFNLAAVGQTRIQYTGNVPQGGTAAMNNGDDLLVGKQVRRGTFQDFQPFTVTNISPNVNAAPASVTYTITDPTGQYSITPPNASLGATQSSTPTIRFSASGVGVQTALLTVNADGEIRTFNLKAFSSAPGGEVYSGSTKLGPSVGLFINQSTCVGEFANTLTLRAVTTGQGDFTIDGFAVYEVDTVYKQGVPTYPLRRDANNQLVPMRDYVITQVPGVAPIQANFPQFPIVVPEGQTRTFYLTYVGQLPGKRFGRAFLMTNGQNLNFPNQNNVPTEGMLTFDLFARSIGSSLSDASMSGLPRTMVFPSIKVGDSMDMTYTFSNPGQCDLKISKQWFKISIGDVRDFKVVSAFRNVIDDGANYVFVPGQQDSIVIRFTPQRGGSRRGTLRVQTNDSSISVPGVSERGSFYLDVYGTGKVGIDYSDIVLKPSVIGGASSSGVISLTNSALLAIDILELKLVGDDSAQFAPDPAYPWPASLPTALLPGAGMKLGVTLTPTGGAGMRRTRLRIITAANDTFYVNISGEAGTRSIAANPTSLFDGTNVTVGTTVRQVLSITNTGSLPLTIQTPVITGSSDYAVGKLPRLTLEPGAVEFVEIFFTPSSATSIPATLTINSDATGGAVTVALNGTGARTSKGSGEDPTTVLPGVESPALRFEHQSNGTTSGVGASEAITGVSLSMAMPNPAREWVVLGYSLDRGRSIELGLYDERGRKLEVLASGMQPSGEHTVRVNVSALASGVYHYRLIVDGKAISKTFTVVR